MAKVLKHKYVVDHKQKLTRSFISKKNLDKKKKRLQSAICSHGKQCARRARRKLFLEGKRKLKGGAAVTIELSCNYCSSCRAFDRHRV